MTTPNEITLANLGNGGLMETATIELRKLCENIASIKERLESFALGIPIIA